MTQNDMIRTHLQSGKSITPLDALREYGCFRLAARIADLRAEGLNIQTSTTHSNGKAYATYRIVGQQELFA
jgi:hypothetical protein